MCLGFNLKYVFFRNRYCGYTRVVKSSIRQKDTAKMGFLEFIDRDGELYKPNRPVPASHFEETESGHRILSERIKEMYSKERQKNIEYYEKSLAENK